MQVAELAPYECAPMQDTGFQLPLAVHGSMELLQKGHSPQTFSSR